MDVETILRGVDAMQHYSHWENRLRREARDLDRRGLPATARKVRESMLIAHRAVINEDRNDQSREGA